MSRILMERTGIKDGQDKIKQVGMNDNRIRRSRLQ